MNSRFLLIYDGECPFCNKFAELVELKSGLANISIKNGRDDLPLLTDLYKQGFDLDNGAILFIDEEIFHGARAVNCICSHIDNPSSSLLEFLRLIFISTNRTKFIFPFLIFARRLCLYFKNIRFQPVTENIQFY